VIYVAGFYYDSVNLSTVPCYWTVVGETATKYDLPLPTRCPSRETGARRCGA
jgi:hypothetical protein